MAAILLFIRRKELKESHELINQDSGNTEWYTPPEIIEAARKTLGTIDFDPFTSLKANEVVDAVFFVTKESDGFDYGWHSFGRGRVWCNHPFSRENNKRIAAKAISEHQKGAEIVMITFAATSEAWFKPLLAYPQCFLYGRTNYFDEQGNKVKGVTKGSVITYLGNNVDKFYEAFKHLGQVKVPYKGD